MGKDKKVKIGYRYFFGIHMGLGRGPVDELVEIRIGDKVAWQGSVGSTTDFIIDAPSLFGGDKNEGGVVGNCSVMMGDPWQQANIALQAMFAGKDIQRYPEKYDYTPEDFPPCPGFRGVATLFFNGQICAMNPYPKAWKMRVRRALKGWDGDVFYPAACIIPMEGGAIKAMNPAHMLYEAATNRDWGRGLDAGRLDIPSYTRAADQLWAEGFGLCTRWTRQDKISTFIQSVLDHIAGIQEIDKTTGLLKLTLIRNDYNADTLHVFDYTNGLVGIEDMEIPAQDMSTNSVVVKFTDPILNEERTTAPVDNLASIQMNGGSQTSTIEYHMIPTLELASRVALRDLQTTMGTLRRLKVHLDRRGFGIMPGSVFAIKVPEMGIEKLVLRAGKVEDGTLDNSEITVSAVEDVFGLPSASYIANQPPVDLSPDLVAREPTLRVMREWSYRDCVRNFSPGDLNTIASWTSFVAGLATKPNGLSLSYEFWTSPTGSLTDFSTRTSGDWPPFAILGGALPASGNPITVPMTSAYKFDQFTVGRAVFVDQEEMVILGVDPANGNVTFGRGAIDTIPQIHAAGARVWLYDDLEADDPLGRLSGTTIQGRFLTQTPQQTLELSKATSVGITLVGRQGRPYPPGNVYINNARVGTQPTVMGGTLTLSWAHRDRVTQNDQLFPHTYGNIGPEAGTTYTVVVKNANGGAVRTVSGITGTSWAYDDAMAAADGYLQNIVFELFSVRSSLESWQRYSIPVTRAGLGFNLGQTLGGIEQ